MEKKKGLSALQKVGETVRETRRVLVEDPAVILIFLLLGLFDFAALLLISLAPSEPVSYAIAPIIRAFWGERFLHYPDNFLLMPELFHHAHFALGCLFGVFFSGLAIKKIQASLAGEKLTAAGAASGVMRKYLALIAVWSVTSWLFTQLLLRTLGALPPRLEIQVSASFALGLVFQSFMAFMLPSILITEDRWFKSVWKGAVFGFKKLFFSFGLLAVPMLFISVLTFFKALAPAFVQYSPEAVFWILSAGIVVSVFVDLFITSSTTVYFLKERGQ